MTAPEDGRVGTQPTLAQPATIHEAGVYSHVASAVREGWSTALIVTLIGLGVTTIKVATRPPAYIITATVLPSQPEGSLSRTMGGLAAFAGIQLEGSDSGVAPFAVYKDLLLSELVMARVDARMGIVRTMYRDRWDPSTNQWKQLTGLAAWKQRLRGFLGLPPPQPSVALLTEELSSGISVAAVTIKDPIYKIALPFGAPELGIRVLSALHEEANSVIRERKRKQTTDSINFIVGKIAITSNAEQRLGLISLLGEREKELVMLASDSSQAAEMLEDAPYAILAPAQNLATFIKGAATSVILGFIAAYVWQRLWAIGRSRAIRRAESRR